MRRKHWLECAISAFGLLVLATPLVPSANAQRMDIYVTGEMLAQDCRNFMFTRRAGGQGSLEQHASAQRCYAYVTGVFDLTAEFVATGRTEPTYCIPRGTNAIALAEIVATYSDKNPAQRNRSGADLVSQAWSAAFPCPSR
jgi:hypothetical protein